MAEPRTSSISQRLVARGAIYTVAIVLQAAGSFLILPILTRVIPQTEFGLVVGATITIQFLIMMAALGLQASITRSYYSEKEGNRASAALVWHAAVIASIVCILVAVTAPLWQAFVIGSSTSAVAVASALTAVPGTIITCVQAHLRAANRKFLFVLLAAVAAVGAPVAGLITAQLSIPTALNYVVGYAAYLSASSILSLVILSKPGSLLRDLGLLKRNLGIGLPTLPHVGSLYVLNMGDRVIIQHFFGLPAVAQYQIGYIVGGISVILAYAVNNAWAPMVYELPAEQRLAFLTTTTRTLVRLAAVGACLLCAVLPWVMPLMAPTSYDYLVLVQVAAIMSVCGIMVVRYLSHVHRLFAAGKTGLLAISTPLSVAFAIAITVPAVLLFGLPGAAAATLLGYLLQIVVTKAAARRSLGVEWSGPPDRWILTLVASVVVFRCAVPSSNIISIVCMASAGVLGVAAWRSLDKHVIPGDFRLLGSGHGAS